MTRLAAADQGRAGLDPARLDDFLRRLTEDGRIPGWSLAIARHGTLAHASTGGYRDTEAGLPIEADTLFRIYSMAKPITAVAALLLCERGDVELSDPVARFIPSFASLRVYARGPDQRPVTEPAVRPVFQPGSEWNYSVGTDVLGRVVEVVTGPRSASSAPGRSSCRWEWRTPRSPCPRRTCPAWRGCTRSRRPAA